tara:strand:+ start:267 stop:572 length:306 start_codon:yes stop_codon:yes gene_type:complete
VDIVGVTLERFTSARLMLKSKVVLYMHLVMAKRKRRSVPKDRKTKLPKKYLGATSGARRDRLAAVLRRISKLYKEGKTVPRSLIQERIRLGKMKRATRKKR